MKVAIVGGGISGIAAARFLLERGASVDVFERDASAGGLMKSDLVDGHVFDRSGGHIFFTKSDWCRQLVNGLYAPDGLVSTERNTKILFRGRFVHYPFENGIGDLDPEERLACVKGYIEAWVRQKSGETVPDNFRDWVRYRMGDGIADAFMDPYNEKIWKADLRELGVDWVEGRVPQAPLDDVLRAAMGQRTEGYTHQSKFQYPRRGGFESIFTELAVPVLPFLRTGVEVRRIERVGERFRVDGTPYDRVISTIPLPALAGVLAGLDAEAAGAARALQHRSLTAFLFGIDGESVKPYSWIYLPHREQGPANRITFLSNYSPENAPAGRGSLLAEVTHAGPLRVDAAYIADLRAALARQGLLDPARVSVEHHHSNEWAYILFDRAFTAKRATAIAGVEQLGVVPLGRFGRFDYHNSDQCIVAARDAVDRLMAAAR